MTPRTRAAGSRRALLAGGGSGGHVFPALAVGEELARRGWAVDFAGSAAGMEARLVGERGLPFHPLPALPLVGRGALDRLRAVWTLLRSTLAARGLVRRLAITVVIGTGGYVSAPAVLGGWLAGRPSLLLEPNAVPGVANRWLSRWASDAAVGFEATCRGLRCPSAVTGVPVRTGFAALPAEPPAGPLRLLVAGGSQGSEQLNRLVPAALGELAAAGSLPALSAVHQAGRGKAEATAAAYAAAGLTPQRTAEAAAETGDSARPRVRVTEFVDDMAGEIGAAHLVVSRGGAITIAEIATAGRASLLVPLGLAGGHQADNARAVEAAGGAVVLESASLDGAALAAALGGLLGDRARLAAMGRAARGLARPDAAAAIADRVERLAARADGAGGAA